MTTLVWNVTMWKFSKNYLTQTKSCIRTISVWTKMCLYLARQLIWTLFFNWRRNSKLRIGYLRMKRTNEYKRLSFFFLFNFFVRLKLCFVRMNIVAFLKTKCRRFYFCINFKVVIICYKSKIAFTETIKIYDFVLKVIHKL